MAKDNTLPSGIHDLMPLGSAMAEGLKLHGPWLKMTQTPEGAFRAVLERLRESETRYSEARVAKGEAGKESTAADKVLTNWLTRTRGFLMSVLGSRWSARWLQVGATSRRTAIPKRMAPRIALAGGFVDFFAKNPRYNLIAAGITEKNGRALRDRLVRAQRKLREAKVECVLKKRTRDAAERALRRKMRQVVVILGVTIRRDDRRWLDFGLNRQQQSLGSARPVATAPLSDPVPLPEKRESAPAKADEAVAA